MKENLRSFICFGNNRSDDFKYSYISRWLLFLCNGLNLILQIREKERIAMEERDPAISQAKKRKKIIASLPKLFNMIDMMFHSKNRSVMTKEELMSNIVSNHRDIIDRSKIHFFKK
jgi:hypothetical protein